MTREEALREILRRAHREHGTCVLTLRRIEREITDLRRRLDEHADERIAGHGAGDRARPGYLAGVAAVVELIENALFDVFNVPVDAPPHAPAPPWGRPPRHAGPEGTPRPGVHTP
ncbi:hypothetical protein [Thermomonospora catenispora]|uniref:hypothetical protein n=1 Tax=Thermomonospora catenispora TaxID=2493090 RepID=UPI00112254CF|nr:hypothetical protein [Thermomonospora catenispora]TNY37954.1 hypothetical protein EIO00_05075 [Thermomonospora catenispora]